MMHRPPPDDFSFKKTKPHLGGGIITGDKITSTYDPVEQMQYLYVRVVKARDLPAKNITGSCDPSAEVRLGNYKGTTRHFEKISNLEWNQVLVFSRDKIQVTMLEVTLKDKYLMKFYFMGRVLFDLSEVPKRVPPDNPVAPLWYRLKDRKGNKLKGELMLAVWWGVQADEVFTKACHSEAATDDEADALANIHSDFYFSPKLWYLRVNLIEGLEFEKQAEKKLNGWGFFGSKYEDAGDLYEKAANCYKLAKSWDRAGSVYVKLAECHLKMGRKHEAANAYADATHSYKKTNTKECIAHLEEASNLFMEIGRLSMSARYCKEIAELYEEEQKLEQAISYYDKAADLFQGEEVTTSANQCKQKIAQFSAQLKQYQKAIEIYEEIARQSLNSNFLKYRVRGHLLNAGICQLCKGDIVAITNALERYQELYPTFTGTPEYKLLADLASAVDEEDVAKFTGAVNEFNNMTKLDEWNTTLLLRVKVLSLVTEDEGR